jgi:hypothetical protein
MIGRSGVIFKCLFYFSIQVGIAILSLTALVAQQQTSRSGVLFDFVNKRTEHSSNEISSNVLRVKNNSSNPINFSLNLTLPDGWVLVSKKSNKYTVRPNDSLFISVNLTPKKINPGNVSHVINAALISDNELQFASAMWYMSTRRESDWTASAIYNKIFFLDESDTARFYIRLQNMGNAEEDIKMNFAADKRLRVVDEFRNNIQLHSHYFKLPVGSDTTLSFKVEKVQIVQQDFREDFDAVRLQRNDYYPLRVTVLNQPGNKSLSKTWRTTIDFIKAGNEAKLKEYQSAALPLTIEANVDNFLDNSTMLNLNLYGNADLEKNRSLSYRYQTFFFNNFYASSPFLGNSHYLGYFSQRTSIELGDVSGHTSLGFTPTGRGIKGNYQVTNSHYAGAFYLRSPGFFQQNNKTDYGLSYEFRRGSTSFENYFQLSNNSILNTSGYQYSNKLRLLLRRSHNVTLATAISSENYDNPATPFSKMGFAYALNYNGIYKRFSYNVTNSFGSAYNIGYRGMASVGADVLYKLSGSQSLSAGAFLYRQEPRYFSPTGILLVTQPSANERYELRYNVNTTEYNASLKLQHFYNEIFNLRSKSNGLGFDFRPKAANDIRFFLSVAGAYNKLLDYDLAPFFTSQINTNLRYKGLSSNVRYYYGPYQTYEQLIFANNKINNQSVFLNLNYRQWLIKKALTFEPSLVYSHETLYKRSRISFRPELYLVPKRGLEVKFYGQYMNNNQRNNPFISPNAFQGTYTPVTMSNLFFGLGVKKKLGVPVSQRRFYKLAISVFKDINGNGKQDREEAGLKNILVSVKPLERDTTAQATYAGMRDNGELFITDADGKVVYNNLPKGIYNVKIVPLTENDGFFAGSEQVVKVDDNKDLMMPLNQGVQLGGLLVAERDQNAADFDKKLDLSKIRITAQDSSGRKYSTLTNIDGRFSIKLPAGIYQVSMNENALPENFQLDQKEMTVEMITVSDNYNITFYIKERPRKKNIKRFDSNGNLMPNN